VSHVSPRFGRNEPGMRWEDVRKHKTAEALTKLGYNSGIEVRCSEGIFDVFGKKDNSIVKIEVVHSNISKWILDEVGNCMNNWQQDCNNMSGNKASTIRVPKKLLKQLRLIALDERTSLTYQIVKACTEMLNNKKRKNHASNPNDSNNNGNGLN